MDPILELVGRTKPLFQEDLMTLEKTLSSLVRASSFLVIGGAGSIGSAVTREIFRRNPRKLHVVDISENNLVETVRDLRSSQGYIDGEFATFAIDCGSDIFSAFMREQGGYDFVLNLSALKHVRSEKDAYTLMRMVEVNILNTLKVADISTELGVKKYFCVSTDKAANPVNMMGASKRIMEMFLTERSPALKVSTARFANVAFSDGSLLHGFRRRIEKSQPISAPFDVRRYFLTPQESGELCLLSTLLGESREVFFPKLEKELNLITFSSIAERFLRSQGFEPVQCESEDAARSRAEKLIAQRKYPVYFFQSDTTGEKDFEEFYTSEERLDMARFVSIGVISGEDHVNTTTLLNFTKTMEEYRRRGRWTREGIVELFNETIPEFHHKETGKFLEGRM